MDDSTQLQSQTQNQSQNAIPFPPYRRRPIRSHTYQILLQILTLCPVASRGQGDIVDVETRSAGEEIGLIGHNEVNAKESDDNALVKDTSSGKSKEVIVPEDESFDRKQTTVSESSRINVVINGEQENNQINTVEVHDCMVIENQSGNSDVKIASDEEKMKSFNSVPADDFNSFEHLNLEEELSIRDFSEVYDSCFSMDMADEPSKDGGDQQNNGSTLDENMHKDIEHELQLKEMELEKLINNPGAVESSTVPTANNEIEEGEISDGSMDSVSEDAVTTELRSTEVVHTSGGPSEKEDSTVNENIGIEHPHKCNSSLVSEDKSSMKVEMRTAPDYNFIYGFQDSCTNTKSAGPVGPSKGSSIETGRNFIDRAAGNQVSLTAGKDDNPNKKKRKKGPMTEERKAKKKKKERLKRAEKNRQLGVKKLKIETVLKPKKIAYCRHYLLGRCHEGEKCKFSHDTVPLTKSKPCSYFARNTCMKGDDCPFDHELSKYPCNNYVTMGYCSRGSDCLFSHEIPANQIHSVAPNVSKPELKSEHQMIHKDVSFVASKFTKPTMNLASTQKDLSSGRDSANHGNKIDAKVPSVGKGAEQLQPKIPPKTPGRPPKGINFLSNKGTTPLSYTNKHKQDASSSAKPSDAVDVSCEKMPKMPDSINKSNEKSEGALRKPRGINFLTFAQPFSDTSTSKMLSNLLSSSSKGSGNLSTAGGLVQGQHTSSSMPESDLLLKDNIQKKEDTNSATPIDIPPSLVRVSKTTTDDNVQKPPFSLFNPSLLSNTPSSVQKAVQSTLAFAEKFDASVRLGSANKQG